MIAEHQQFLSTHLIYQFYGTVYGQKNITHMLLKLS